MNNALSVKEYNDFEVLKDIQQEWDNFVEANGADIFMTYDWCRIWWKYYGKNRDLKIFIFCSNDNLVGIMPLFFEKIWLGPVFIRAVKIVGSDFTLAQFFLPIDKDSISQVIYEFFKVITEYKWDILHIGVIAGLCDNVELFEEALRTCAGKFHSIKVCKKGVQIYVELSDSWEDHINKLSTNQRRSIKRSYKEITKIEKDRGMSLICNFASKNDFEMIFKGFVQMHQLHWQQLNKGGHFTDWPSSFDFHKEVAIAQMEHNRLRLAEVKLGDNSLAYQYNFLFGNIYYAFLNALPRDSDLIDICPKVSVGRILYGEVIKSAIKENVRYIDMMRGEDYYKIRLGGKPLTAKNIFVSRRKFGVLVRAHMFRALAKGLNLCYYKIWFMRILPRMPFKRRQLPRLWVRTHFFS